MQLGFIQQENDRTRRECLKMLEVEKFKAQKLEESLVEKGMAVFIKNSISTRPCSKYGQKATRVPSIRELA